MWLILSQQLNIAVADAEGRDSVGVVNHVCTYGREFSRHLAKGLADNWSQVIVLSCIQPSETEVSCIYLCH